MYVCIDTVKIRSLVKRGTFEMMGKVRQFPVLEKQGFFDAISLFENKKQGAGLSDQ